jgi:hypothetical protein
MRKTSTVLVLLLLAATSHAQKFQGIQTIGIQGYKSDFGFMASVNYQKYFTNTLSAKLAGAGEMSNLLNMDHTCLYLNAEMFKDFLKSTNKHVLNVGGGASIQYDQLDKRKELGEAFVRNSFNLGLIGTADYQYYLSKKVMVNASFTMNYNFVTKFAPTKFWGGIGFHYIIN